MHLPTFITRAADGSSRRPRSLPPIIGLMLIVGAGALRFYHIGTQSLWVDEGFTLVHADTRSIATTIRLILESNSTERFSPLYPLLLHGVIQILGNSELALRSFSAICGVATVIAVMAAAASFFGRRAALFAGVLIASSSFAIWYSQEARPYSLMLLLVSLQLWALGRYVGSTQRDHTRAGRFRIAVVSGVGLFGNILFAISSLSLCLAHLVTTFDRRRWWAGWWPVGVASVPAMLFYLASPLANSPAAAGVEHLQQNALMNLGYSIFGQLVGITYGPPQVALRGADKLPVLGEYLPALACAGLLGLALIVTMTLARRLRTSDNSSWSNYSLLGFSIMFAAGCAATFVVVTRLNWQPRHAYFVFPPALLVVSFALSELSRTSNQVLRGLTVATLAVFLGTNAWSLHNYYNQPEYGKDDYRGVAAYLNQIDTPRVPSVLVHGRGELLRYYGDAKTMDLTDVPDSVLLPRLLTISQHGGEVVVVINRKFYWWGGTEPNVVFGAVFDVQHLKALQYFDVYRLAVRAKESGG